MPNVVTLHARGNVITGWTEISIVRSMEQPTDSFTVKLVERALGQPGHVRDVARSVFPYDDVEIKIDGITVITGYVTKRPVRYGAEQHSVSVSGSSRTIDLVDCSAVFKGQKPKELQRTRAQRRAIADQHGYTSGAYDDPESLDGKDTDAWDGVDGPPHPSRRFGGWRDTGLQQIAQDLCEPYEIEVDSEADLGAPFKRFAIEDGETVFETIRRGAKLRGVLVVATAEGNLRFVNAAKAPSGAVIERGVNVLDGGVDEDVSGRFSEYRFKGQTSATDDWFGDDATQIENVVQDVAVPRYRPLIVHAEQQGHREDLGRRALWERNTRAGKSTPFDYEVPEWFWSEDKLWEPNILAWTKDDWCGVDASLLLASVEFTLSERGRRTRLSLFPRHTFDPYLPIRPPRSAAEERLIARRGGDGAYVDPERL